LSATEDELLELDWLERLLDDSEEEEELDWLLEDSEDELLDWLD
jgi:hypothetical protein